MHPSTKRLYEVAFLSGHTSPAQIAAALNQSDQTVSNWSTRGVSKDGAIAAEQAYGCSPNWILHGIVAKAFVKTGCSVAYFEYLDAKAACGDGYINHDSPATVTRVEMSVDYAQELVGNTNKSGHIKLFSASGDSMAPTINPRDLLFVDTACQDMRGEGIYLIFHADGLACKRLLKLGKRIRVCSDNEMHRDRDWDWSDRDQTTRIVGKVVASLPLAIRRYE